MEAARIQDVIKEAILKPGARPSEYELALLRHATLSECCDAFILHGFSKATTERRRADVSTHLRLAIKESDANGMLPGSLQAATISHAARKHSASTARKRVEALRVMYRWLKLYKAVDNNPAEDVPSFDPVPVRDRYADADELRRIWNACDQLQKPRADFLRLLILLPLRRGELSELRVGDIQENHGLLELRIPKERSKNKLAHALPIVGSAAEIIQSYLTAGRKKDELLIPLASGGRLFSGWTIFKSNVAKLSRCDWFYFHMTRKMFATEGVEHNLDDPSVIDGCLNHAANAGHQNYDFSRRLTRRATLLSNWQRVVAEAVRTGVWPRHAPASLDNVVSIGVGR
jgi:integrase